MLIRIMTLKFNPVLEQFDDVALQDYLKDKEILCVKDHFFAWPGAAIYLRLIE